MCIKLRKIFATAVARRRMKFRCAHVLWIRLFSSIPFPQMRIAHARCVRRNEVHFCEYDGITRVWARARARSAHKCSLDQAGRGSPEAIFYTLSWMSYSNQAYVHRRPRFLFWRSFSPSRVLLFLLRSPLLTAAVHNVFGCGNLYGHWFFIMSSIADINDHSHSQTVGSESEATN